MGFFDIFDPAKDARALRTALEDWLHAVTLSLVDQIIPKAKEQADQLAVDVVTNLSNEVVQNIVPALEKAGHNILDGLTITATVSITRKS